MRKMSKAIVALAMAVVVWSGTLPVDAKAMMQEVAGEAVIEAETVEVDTMEAEDEEGVGALSGAVIAKGKCGDKITWKLTKKGVLKIKGKGEMWDFAYGQYDTDGLAVPWVDYQGKIKKVVISDKITKIGRYSFIDCTKLKKVIFGKDVEIISTFAFHGCTKLKNYVLPAKLKTIGDGAFAWNKSVTEVKIPNKIEYIGYDAFFANTSLQKVVIGGNKKVIVCSVMPDAFGYCQQLTKIKVAKKNVGLKSVNGVLYNKNMDTLLQYPAGKKAKKYTVPKKVKHIQNRAISYASNMQKVVLPKGLESIGDGNFWDCKSLKKLEIPASVTSIGSDVGGWNPNLRYIQNNSSVEMELARVFGLVWINDETKKEQIDYLSQGRAYVRGVVYDFEIPKTMDMVAGTTDKFEIDVQYAFQTTDGNVYTKFRDDDFLYSSDNEAVVTVSEDGVITAVAPGTATITVTGRYTSPAIKAVTQTCVITVVEADTASGMMILIQEQ